MSDDNKTIPEILIDDVRGQLRDIRKQVSKLRDFERKHGLSNIQKELLEINKKDIPPLEHDLLEMRKFYGQS